MQKLLGKSNTIQNQKKMIRITNEFNNDDHVIYKKYDLMTQQETKYSGFIVGIKYIETPFLCDDEGYHIPYRIYYGIYSEDDYTEFINYINDGKKAPERAMYWAPEEDIMCVL